MESAEILLDQFQIHQRILNLRFDKSMIRDPHTYRDEKILFRIYFEIFMPSVSKIDETLKYLRRVSENKLKSLKEY